MQALLASLENLEPQESSEVALLDAFIADHAQTYVLTSEDYPRLMSLLVQNRIYNAKWQYGTATKPHLVRVLQTIRILARAPPLIAHFIAANGVQFLCQKLHEVTSQNQRQSEFPEEICDLLIELSSILYKTVRTVGPEHRALIQQHVLTEDILSDLQILLAVRHNVLLKCIFESILTIFEFAQSEPDSRIDSLFCNKFTVDKLLVILESFSDDFRVLAAETLTHLLRGAGQADQVRIFKELGGSEKLMSLLMTTSAHSDQLKVRLLVCLQTLTSGENQDILQELFDLGAIHLLLNLLVQTSKETTEHQQAVPGTCELLGVILTCLTQLSMHDQSNVKLRLHGAHLVGQILMQNCP